VGNKQADTHEHIPEKILRAI